MPSESTQKAPRKPTARSRVTNGSSLGEGIDGRTVWARRLRDLVEDYTDDLMLPRDQIPNTVKSMIRRAAVLTVELERAEAGFAENGKADASALNEYQRVANSLRRILESLNIKGDQGVNAGSRPNRWDHKYGGVALPRATSLSDLALVDHSPASNRDLARAICWAITVSEREGKPLDPTTAAMAERLREAERERQIDIEQLAAEAAELYAEEPLDEAAPANDGFEAMIIDLRKRWQPRTKTKQGASRE